MDILQYNRDAWNHQVDKKDKWTIPVAKEEIELARNGIFSIVLTPTKPVPMEWFGKIKDAVVLCLASGGGQQVPIFAAAGAHVTSFDNSEKQLRLDLAGHSRADIKKIAATIAKLNQEIVEV